MNRGWRIIDVGILTFVGMLLLVLTGQGERRSELSAGQLLAPRPQMITSPLFVPLTLKGYDAYVFSDEFSGDALDPSTWYMTGTVPSLSGGDLVLDDTEIQSWDTFQYGILRTKVGSTDWKIHDPEHFTDASFGFERWSCPEGGCPDGACHDGVVFKGNGYLGVLQRSVCDGVIREEYVPLPGWNDIVAEATSFNVTLEWSPSEIMLSVNDGAQYSAVITSTLVPTVPLHIRLNSAWETPPHSPETYELDYIRLYQEPR